MTAVKAQTGRISRLGFSQQGTAGTWSVPTNEVRSPDAPDLTDDPNVSEFEAENGSRDPVDDSREGIHKVDFKHGVYLRPVQGAPLWKSAVGPDTISGVGAVTVTLSAAVLAGDTILSLTAIPALPSGVSEWNMSPVQVDTGGANPETKHILAVDPVGKTFTVTPMKFSHLISSTSSIPIHHIFQPGTGAMLDDLQLLSYCMQYGTLYEKRIADALVDKLSLKAVAKEIKLAYELKAQSIPGTSTSLTSWSAAAGELTDRPFMLKDGGLITNFTQADTAPSMHNRILTLDMDLMNNLLPREYGGGAQSAEALIPGDRLMAVKWTEDHGQNGANPDIYTQYVVGQAYLPSFFSFFQASSGFTLGIWFPRCFVKKYKEKNGPKDVIGFDGEITPQKDPTSGKSIKVTLYNGVTTAY